MGLSPLGSESEGDKQYKAAEKLSQGSLLALRFKADWASATPLFEQAAQNFKQSKVWAKAIKAFERAAHGQERLNSPWHAAKHLDKAAECSKELGQLGDVAGWALRAAGCYEEAGRQQPAAEALSKAARFIEESDPVGASELYARAVKSLEAEGKAASAADIYRRATGNELRNSNWAAAAGFQLRWAVACGEAELQTSQCRAYLAAVIIWLAGQDARQAYLCHQDALQVCVFTCSNEAFAAEELLTAFRSNNATQIAKLITPNSVFMNIDNQISRLAKQLPASEGLLPMAAALSGLMRDSPVVDQTIGSGGLGVSDDANEDELDLS